MGGGYTAGCLFYYDYIKNRYLLIAVDLSRQKEFDIDPKATSQIELIRRYKKLYANNNNNKSKETHWLLFLLDRKTELYFVSFGMEYISQKALNKPRDKSISSNIFKIEGGDSVMCGFYCITFIEYIFSV